MPRHALANRGLCAPRVSTHVYGTERRRQRRGHLHQPRERRQHVDRRVDLPVVQRAININLNSGKAKSAKSIIPCCWISTRLPLRDVPSQIRDGVRDVIVGHRENGELRTPPATVTEPTRHDTATTRPRTHTCVMDPFEPSTRPARS